MRMSGFAAAAALAATIAAPTAVIAQQVMDGSDKGISEADLTALRKTLSASLRDPYGSQLEELKLISPERICGRMNTKNGLGAFTGFRPFGANLKTGELALVPERQPAENAPTEELETAIRQLKAFIAMCEPPKP